MTPLIVSSITLASILSLFGSPWALPGYCVGIVAAALDRAWIDRIIGLDRGCQLAIVGFLIIWSVIAGAPIAEWAGLVFVGAGAMMLGLAPARLQARAFGVLAIAGLMSSALSIVRGFGPPGGFLVPNDLLFVSCLLLLGCSTVKDKKQPALLIIALAVSGIFLAILARSRLLLLVTCVSIGFLIMTTRMDRASGMRTVGALVAIIAIAIGLEPASIAKLSAPMSDRWQLWRVAWDGFLVESWLGHGWNTFAQFVEVHPLRVEMIDIRSIPWPHSLWLETLFCGGLALLSSLLFVVGCAARGFRFRHDPFLSASLIAFITTATFEASWLRWWTWWVFFYLIGRLVPRDWRHG